MGRSSEFPASFQFAVIKSMQDAARVPLVPLVLLYDFRTPRTHTVDSAVTGMARFVVTACRLVVFTRSGPLWLCGTLVNVSHARRCACAPHA